MTGILPVFSPYFREKAKLTQPFKAWYDDLALNGFFELIFALKKDILL